MNIDNTNIPFADKVQLPTIRDQIAMAALASLDLNVTIDTTVPNDFPKLYTIVARQAYAIADAMLEARAE